MKISFSSPATPKAGALVLTVAQDRALGPFGTALDGETGGAIGRAMEAARFTGKADETLTLLAPSGTTLSRIVLVGLGAPAAVTAKGLQSAGGAAMAALAKAGAEVALAADAHDGIALPAAEAAAQLAMGLRLRSFRFDKYKTRGKDKDEARDGVRKVTVLSDAAAAAKKAFAGLDALADGVFLTRELACEPANVMFPEALAERCAELSKLGVEVEVLDEKRMRKMGMGALLGVGQGSVNGPRLVVMRWNGNGDAQPVAFVGKGVTFDTGGISIKPAAGMEDMKYDMCGAAAVIGLMRALAGRKAKANVVGVVGLVENMPDGKAQRPGDIVTSMSGQTIEVLNTDAEGRLVLADALWYTQSQVKPRCMIDLATLTGAIVVSLGGEYAGLFSNNDELAAQITEAGRDSGEEVWRMPLGAAYDRDIDSDHADMKNIGSPGKAGSIIGAVFLQRFVNGLPWAHIDIAGTAWSKKDTNGGPKGATGFGVRLLDRLVRSHFEG
jgi:leucyl aminopeptidase